MLKCGSPRRELGYLGLKSGYCTLNAGVNEVGRARKDRARIRYKGCGSVRCSRVQKNRLGSEVCKIG